MRDRKQVNPHQSLCQTGLQTQVHLATKNSSQTRTKLIYYPSSWPHLVKLVLWHSFLMWNRNQRFQNVLRYPAPPPVSLVSTTKGRAPFLVSWLTLPTRSHSFSFLPCEPCYSPPSLSLLIHYAVTESAARLIRRRLYFKYTPILLH
jgi:hypothetical protein